MRILFFADSLIAGGQERRMLELIKYLRQNEEFEISLVITDENVFYNYAHDLGIDIKIIERRGLRYDPRLFIKFWKHCMEFRPDLIHAWGKMTTLYAIPSKLLLKRPLISNLVADSKRIIKRWSLDKIFYSADIHFSDIVLSNSMAGLKAYKIKSRKARVIPNGVDLKRFDGVQGRDYVRGMLQIKTTFTVIMVACFTASKDYDLFLDVAKEMNLSRKDVTFLGVGDGPELDRIKRRVADENIHNVVLAGNQEKVEQFIEAADIGLLCTYSEGLSNSVIEYMALGKPVIVTDLTGGSSEIIEEGVTGFCTNRNPSEIISLLKLLLDDKTLRTSMGSKGRELIFSSFSLDNMGVRFTDLYKEVLS